MLNPFIDLLSSVIRLYTFCVIVWAVMSTLISFKIINAYQPVVRRVMEVLDRLCEPVLRRIRKFLPDLNGIDLSPVILFLLLNFLNSALYTYFYNL